MLRYGSLKSTVFLSVREFPLHFLLRWMSELEALANLFRGTFHPFTETVPLCHEQPNNYWSRKKWTKLYEGFGNSEEACFSTCTSRQSPFKIDRHFTESTNQVFRAGVLLIFFYYFFYHLPATLPLLTFPPTWLGDFGLLRFFLPAKNSYEYPIDRFYSRSVIFNFFL